MSANIFKVDGKKVYSQQEFESLETEDHWRNIQYYSERFESKERQPIVFSNKVFECISFKDTDFNNIKFIGCVFRQCLFIGATFTNCEFIRCKFIETNTSKLRIKSCLLDPKNFENNFDLINDANIAIGLYHALYKNSSEEHQPEYALESLYLMEIAKKAQLKSKRKRGVITTCTYYRKKFRFELCDFISGFGLKPLRVIRLLLLVFVVFLVLNCFLSTKIFDDKINSSFIDTIYFTVVTITTLGFGDIVPVTSLGKVLIAFQAFVGFIVISLFVAAIINIAVRVR